MRNKIRFDKSDSEYYDSHPGPKCTRQCFNQRIIRGITKEEAIEAQSMKRSPADPNADGRICYHCGVYLLWEEFTCKPGAINNRGSTCKKCMRLDYSERKGQLYKKRYPEGTVAHVLPSVENEMTKALDAMYENDPIIKNNKRILGKILPEKDFINKVHYLQSCGFSSVALSKAYGVVILPAYWEKNKDA